MMVTNKGKFGLLVAGLCLVFLVFPITAQAADYHVPGTYSTIQAAINAAAGGNNTVVVAAGTYSPSTNGESFPIYFPAQVGQYHRYLTVQGAGAGLSILDAENTGAAHGGVMVLEETGNNVVVDGFTMTGGNASFHGGGISVVAYGSPWSKPTIQNCEIRNNIGYGGGGVSCNYAGQFSSNDYPRFINCMIVENASTGYGGAGVEINDCKAYFINCTIAYNLDLAPYPASVFLDGGNAYLSNCVITSDHYSGTPMAFDSYSGSDAIQVNNCNFNPSHNLCPLLGGSGSNINVTPGFVSGVLWYPGYFPGGGDYHLIETSAMIDQGTSSLLDDVGNPIPFPSDDFEGDSRVAPPDLGGDEYSTGGPTCVDNDTDGYGVCPDCDISNGCTYDGDDCDDTDEDINPGATEVCDGVDNDCDTIIDPPGSGGCTTYYKDSDDDTYGVTGDTQCLCAPSGDYTATVGGDCNDGDDTIYPGATEIVCDGIDQDCSGADDCSMPASAAYDTHISGTGKGPDPLDCDVCHAVGGGDSYVLAEMVANGNCDTCHSPDGAFDGVNDATIGAAANWTDGVYETDATTLKAGKEQWCAGCHDGEPAYSQAVVATPVEVIVDNEDPEFDSVPVSPDPDYWRCKYKAGSYNGSETMCYNSPGTGSAVATWTPDLPYTGDYKVYAWWVQGGSRATNSPYTIYYDGGSATVEANQKIGGYQWNELGTYSFAAGTSGSVELSDDADGYVIADAVRFVYQAPDAPQGVYAPDVIGDATTYGFYVNGHGAPTSYGCANCHDAGKSHIDHLHRTYASLLDNYVDGFRLKAVNGYEAMNVPRTRKSDVYAVLDDFALCFDCHNFEEVLGQDINDVSHTNFWNETGGYNANLHTTHLQILDNKNTDSDRNGTGDTAPTCVGCHNVHGPQNQAMLRRGELVNGDIFPPDFKALNFAYVTSMGPPIVSDPTASLVASVGGIMDWAGNTPLTNGTCKATCHGTPPVYERTAKPWPKVINAKAAPESVVNDGSDSTLLTVFVSDPNGDLSSVQVDLSSVGGSSTQAMYDNATNGDVTAGDGTYSYLHPIAYGTSEGDWSLSVTATDAAANTGTNTISLAVTAPGALVVDNVDAGFTTVSDPPEDTWGCKVQTGSYGVDGTRCHNSPGTGSSTATWIPDIPEAGDYEVYAWWVQGSSRATDAPYTITYNGGSVTVDVNQKTDGSQWNSLGIYPFAAGTSGSVVLSDDADGYVIADAVRLEKQ